MQALFDLPSEYDDMLQKGIGVTGNDKYFFIKGRLERVKENLENAPLKILDFGCGIGDSTVELERLFPHAEIVGSDLSEEALNYARQKFSASKAQFVALSDLEINNQFDLVYLNCVIHHVPLETRQDVVNQLFSLTKDNGKIFIFENNPANPGTRLAMWTNPFDKGVVKVWPKQLKTMMKRSGYAIQKTEFIFYFPQCMSIFRPMEKWFLEIPLGGQYGVLAYKPVSTSI